MPDRFRSFSNPPLFITFNQLGALLPQYAKIAASFFQDLMERDQKCGGEIRPKRVPFLPSGIRWTGCAGGNVRRRKKVCGKRLKRRNTYLKRENKCSISVACSFKEHALRRRMSSNVHSGRFFGVYFSPTGAGKGGGNPPYRRHIKMMGI